MSTSKQTYCIAFAIVAATVSAIAHAEDREVKVVGRTSAGLPIVDVSVSSPVSLAGLDLGSNAGVAELSKRITEAARAACKELGLQYPQPTTDDDECVQTAVTKAMAKVHASVAVAQGPGR